MPAEVGTQAVAAKEALRKAALEVFSARSQVDASEALRQKAAVAASDRQAAVEALSAQYKEIMIQVTKANARVVTLMKVGGRVRRALRMCGRGGEAPEVSARQPKGPDPSRLRLPAVLWRTANAPAPRTTPQEVARSKLNLKVAGAALALQRGATSQLQGQLNTTLAAEAAASGAEATARAKVQAAADELAAALAEQAERNGTLAQISALGAKTKAAGDPNKQLPLIQLAIDEAAYYAEVAASRAANATAAKAGADAALAAVGAAQDLAELKLDGLQAVMRLAANETATLQARRARGACAGEGGPRGARASGQHWKRRRRQQGAGAAAPGLSSSQ